MSPLSNRWPTEAFWFVYLQEKRHVLRSDKDVERPDDKKEARAEGGRQFQRDGPATERDLDLVIVVVVRGQRAPACHGSVDGEGTRQRSEIGYLTDIFSSPIWFLIKGNKENFVFNERLRVEIGSQCRCSSM